MELAVEKGHSEIVYYFFKETDIDTSQFNEVINSWSVFCAMHHSVMLGITGSKLYYLQFLYFMSYDVYLHYTRHMNHNSGS